MNPPVALFDTRVSVVTPLNTVPSNLLDFCRTYHEMSENEDELILSVDKTIYKNLLNEFQKLDLFKKNIKIIQVNESDLVSALNEGITAAKNDWIVRLDIDDRYSINRIKYQKQLLSENVVAVFCDYIFIDKNSKFYGYMPSAINDQLIKLSLIKGIRTPHSGSIFSKKAFLEAGMYRKKCQHFEDLDLWLRISRLGRFASVPEPLLQYKLHPKSKSMRQYKEIKKDKKSIDYLDYISVKFAKDLLGNLDTYFKSYENLKMTEERKLLTLLELRDFGHISKSKEIISESNILLLKQIATHLPSATKITKYAYFRRLLRAKYRKLRIL